MHKVFTPELFKAQTRPGGYSCAQSQIVRLTHELNLLTPEGRVQIKPIITKLEIVFRVYIPHIIFILTELLAEIVKLTH